MAAPAGGCALAARAFRVGDSLLRATTWQIAGSGAGDERRRDRTEALAADLGARIELAHRDIVEPALQRDQRGMGARQPLLEPGPVEQHRVVARKVGAVIDQHA